MADENNTTQAGGGTPPPATQPVSENQIGGEINYEELLKTDASLQNFLNERLQAAQKSADDWKEKHEKETGELNEKLQKQMLNSKLEIGLLSAKAKNITAAKALLDLEQIKLEGESLVGFNEQLEKITGENPYLFGEAEKNPTPGNGDSDTKPIDTLSGALAERYKN